MKAWIWVRVAFPAACFMVFFMAKVVSMAKVALTALELRANKVHMAKAAIPSLQMANVALMAKVATNLLGLQDLKVVRMAVVALMAKVANFAVSYLFMLWLILVVVLWWDAL